MDDLEKHRKSFDVLSASKAEAIEETAGRVLEAVRLAGPLTLMPNPAMPISGILIYVHPDVYAALKRMTVEVERQSDG